MDHKKGLFIARWIIRKFIYCKKDH